MSSYKLKMIPNKIPADFLLNHYWFKNSYRRKKGQDSLSNLGKGREKRKWEERDSRGWKGGKGKQRKERN